MRKSLFFLFTLLLAFSACRKDDITTTTTTVLPAPGLSVNAGVYGLVADSDNNPIAAAAVQWGNQTTQTDENGFFRIANAVISERNAQLRVQKAGYWTALPSFSPGQADALNVTVKLRARSLNQSFSATTTAQLDVDGQATVALPAAYTTADGQAYTGEVNAYATYLDPTDPNLWEVMPGNLRALDATNGAQLLRTFGMVNVELETPAGEPLQIAETATLRMNVPAELQSDAPSTIPLWYFDETTGLWLEEGEATLQNGVYVGMVAHFTWWNCDVPENFVFLQGQINPSIGDPIYDIRFTVVSNSNYGILTTDNKGNFAGHVPKNELLLLEILDNCGQVVYSTQIGPFSENTQLAPITFVPDDEGQFTVSGTLIGCNNEPVSNGYVSLTIGQNSRLILLQPDGSFSFTGTDCGATAFQLLGVDTDNAIISELMTYPMGTVVAVGTLIACDQVVEQYVRFTHQGVDYEFEQARVVDIQSDLFGLQAIHVDPTSGGYRAYSFTFQTVSVTGAVTRILTYASYSDYNNPDLPVFSISNLGIDLTDFDRPNAAIGGLWQFEYPTMNIRNEDTDITEAQPVSFSALVQ